MKGFSELDDVMLADVRRLMSEGRCLPQDQIDRMTDQELAIWYNDNVIYPDKVRLNLLLQALFLYQGHTDDTLYCVGEEDEVCRGSDIG